MFKLHELLRAFSRHHGEMLNTSAVARTLAVTPLRVGQYLEELRSRGYIRLLPACSQPIAADMVRKPRLYLRRRGWKQAFAEVASPQGCRRVPLQVDLASRITDEIIERESSRRRPSRFYCLGRYRRRGVDLVVQRASGWRIGFCFEPRIATREYDSASEALLEALERGWIDAAILTIAEGLPVVGRRSGLIRVPSPLLLTMYSQWTDELLTPEDLDALAQWLATSNQIIVGVFCSPYGPLLIMPGDYLPAEEEWLASWSP